MTEDKEPAASVADALDTWRQAERVLAAAHAERDASQHAIEVAARAEEAATRTAEAARLALAASTAAAESAQATAEAAREMTRAARSEHGEKRDLASAAITAEADARAAYHAAEEAAHKRQP